MSAHTDTWKKHERTVAYRLSARRVGPSGIATADVVNEHLAVECKMRASLPKWLHDAMSQAIAAAQREQLPVVILHELGRRHDGDYVVVRLKDFEDLWGTVWKGEGAE